MSRRHGFTLIELMVAIAILGILGASAVQYYRTIQHRACGSEATMMLRDLLDAEVIYFLDHNEFFPQVGHTLTVFHDDLPVKPEIIQIRDALKIAIPVGHFLDFTITTLPGQTSMITVSSVGNSFPLFKDGSISYGYRRQHRKGRYPLAKAPPFPYPEKWHPPKTISDAH